MVVAVSIISVEACRMVLRELASHADRLATTLAHDGGAPYVPGRRDLPTCMQVAAAWRGLHLVATVLYNLTEEAVR